MSSPTVTISQSDFDQLQKYLIIGVSVFGGVSILLLCLVIGLYIWNAILTRRISKLDPMMNFKLKRPKLLHGRTSPVMESKRGHDNPIFLGDLKNNRQNGDLNPIANRTKTSFDNGNFIFGQPPKSFRDPEPDYHDRLRDSRFY